jgi:3-oxoacyl-[acyl-carrier protein] reductase
MTARRRVAIITGAAGGLGSAVAQLLASSGHDLMLVDIRTEALANAVGELSGSGARAEQMTSDLGCTLQCGQVVDQTIQRLGRVDILVNAASILARRPLNEVTGESFDEIFHVNCRAPFFLMRAAIADMAKRQWGRIVNVTSVGVYEGGQNMTSAPYEGTKGAVSVFTKMFAKYGAPYGVLVNSVCPGLMKTRMIVDGTPPEVVKSIAEMTPLKRMAEPIEVARMVVWLCGDENSYATGATFDIVGGWVMP